MSESPDLFELFGSASLTNLLRSIKEGKVPSAEQLAAVLEANAGRPLPPWFVELLARSLRGELKKKRGRPSKDDDLLYPIRFQVAVAKYGEYLAWLQKRQRSLGGLEGWSAVRGKDWWLGPPHEAAARMATARWLPRMNWNSFLNEVSHLQKKDAELS